jgi:NO-binding membrane sensor protein with MHYT domain
MTVTYDPVLVLLSIGVAILGSLTALALSSRSQEQGTWRTSFTLANSGLIMGSTIWSMHFVAMMAVSVPVSVNYGIAETVGSICIAIAATGIGLYLTRTRMLGIGSIPVGGLLMGLASMAALWFTFTGRGVYATLGGGVVQGLAIASMHYTAMAATFFVPLDVPVALSAPLFSQSALAYLIAVGMAVVSAGNLVLLGAMSGERARSAA